VFYLSVLTLFFVVFGFYFEYFFYSEWVNQAPSMHFLRVLICLRLLIRDPCYQVSMSKYCFLLGEEDAYKHHAYELCWCMCIKTCSLMDAYLLYVYTYISVCEDVICKQTDSKSEFALLLYNLLNL